MSIQPEDRPFVLIHDSAKFDLFRRLSTEAAGDAGWVYAKHGEISAAIADLEARLPNVDAVITSLGWRQWGEPLAKPLIDQAQKHRLPLALMAGTPEAEKYAQGPKGLFLRHEQCYGFRRQLAGWLTSLLVLPVSSK